MQGRGKRSAIGLYSNYNMFVFVQTANVARALLVCLDASFPSFGVQCLFGCLRLTNPQPEEDSDAHLRPTFSRFPAPRQRGRLRIDKICFPSKCVQGTSAVAVLCPCLSSQGSSLTIWAGTWRAATSS